LQQAISNSPALLKQCEHNKLPCYLRSLSSGWATTKDVKTEQLLCWRGMTDTEHNATSGSNKVVFVKCLALVHLIIFCLIV